ncbi:hypothetical protein PM082_015834 [Marasmius tenuissimus]|nr:hypothetical protein PM082_015834 [Marasmius tenuissimus]
MHIGDPLIILSALLIRDLPFSQQKGQSPNQHTSSLWSRPHFVEYFSLCMVVEQILLKSGTGIRHTRPGGSTQSSILRHFVTALII